MYDPYADYLIVSGDEPLIAKASSSKRYRIVYQVYKTPDFIQIGNNITNKRVSRGFLYDIKEDVIVKIIDRGTGSFDQSYDLYKGKEYLFTGRSQCGINIIDCQSGKEEKVKKSSQMDDADAFAINTSERIISGSKPKQIWNFR